MGGATTICLSMEFENLKGRSPRSGANKENVPFKVETPIEPLGVSGNFQAGKLNVILDEPTSGLDARSSQLVIELMKNLAAPPVKTNVIAVLHTPRCDSFFNLFDYILVLASDGLVAYSGPPNECKLYFTALGYT
ncbi:hypothetical protein GPECTOR_37g148 [Gonium pectorale]|uniref:ABC transporter family G domain-containing protein n=1 Tax=Gonium pectorale TaxID=33097 RepID=A0A150GBK1_GONPE|nr:hypothetical protein GPECTOR_37g148 [Gonium pectorale]|eukprot:KXZ47143.1 hypothetical protein GPECTOR_37g148 [Gonium pectorale]